MGLSGAITAPATAVLGGGNQTAEPPSCPSCGEALHRRRADECAQVRQRNRADDQGCGESTPQMAPRAKVGTSARQCSIQQTRIVRVRNIAQYTKQQDPKHAHDELLESDGTRSTSSPPAMDPRLAFRCESIVALVSICGVCPIGRSARLCHAVLDGEAGLVEDSTENSAREGRFVSVGQYSSSASGRW